MKFDERRVDLWNRLHSVISNNQGFVTSTPHTNPLRFEVAPGSDLIDWLDEKGFTTRHAGTTARMVPVPVETQEFNSCRKVVRDQLGNKEFAIYEISI